MVDRSLGGSGRRGYSALYILCGSYCVSLMVPVLLGHFPPDDCGPWAPATPSPLFVPQDGDSFLLLSLWVSHFFSV